MSIITFTQSTFPGPPGLNLKGNWNNATTYVKNDLVTYLGSSWGALSSNTNVIPVLNSATWQLIAQKGNTGSDGTSITSVDAITDAGDYGKTFIKITTKDLAKSSLGISDLETNKANKTDLAVFSRITFSKTQNNLTLNQSTFTITGGYTLGTVIVIVNGLILISNIDFTATDGNIVNIINSVLDPNVDVVEILSYKLTGVLNVAPLIHTHTKTDIGLSNVDNTSDANKVLSGPIKDALALLAPKISPIFNNNILISSVGDSILQLETTAASNTSFRRKSIYSSVNTGNGNDWLFRSTRPSDGLNQDVTLSGGGPNTNLNIWTSGNLNPSSSFIDTYNTYGVRADGTDQYQKIQNALALAGGLINTAGYGGLEVRLPGGFITVSQHLEIPSGASLVGAGPESTVLISANQNDSIVYVGPNTVHASCRNLSVLYTGSIPYNSNAKGFHIQGIRGNYSGIRAFNCAWAFHVYGGNNNLFTDYVGNGYGLGGIYNEGTTVQNPDGSYRGAIDNFWFNGRLECNNTQDYAQLGTVRCANNCEGFHMVGLSALGGKYGLIINSVSDTHGRRPQFMWFNGCMFDSHVLGSQLNHFSQSRFTDCWFAGAGYVDGTGQNTNHDLIPGLLINSFCFDIGFNSTYINSNAGAGVKILDATDTSFVGCTFAGNGRYGDAQGIDFKGDGLIVTGGCRFYRTNRGVGDASPQTYSLVLRASSTGIIITNSNARDCALSNQTTGTIINQSNIGI